MESKSSGQPTTKNEVSKQKEMVVPQEIAHALGRGLKQMLTEPISNIQHELAILESVPKVSNENWEENMDAASEGLQAFSKILDQLACSKEVKFVQISGGFDFKFSEGVDITIPKKGTLIMDENLTLQFRIALFHHYGNSFGMVMGHSDAISNSKDEKTKQQAKKLHSFSLEIAKILSPLVNVHRIQMTTNDNGETTIVPIQKPQNNLEP